MLGRIGDFCSSGCKWRDFRVVLLGQVISLHVTTTGVFSQLLSRDGVNIPTTQSSLMYLLLTLNLVYSFWVKSSADQQGKCNLQISWWKYALLALCDVEANYFVVKAYQYSTISSIMLIDCFTIPSVMVLSRVFLKVTYRWQHFVAVALCVLGLTALVFSDSIEDEAQGSRRVLGDMLAVVGSMFYAISNVGQEAIVKTFKRAEYLGMLGAFGTIFNTIQLGILESHELGTMKWTVPIVLYAMGFALTLLSMYTLTSYFLGQSDSALFNLSLLTSDLYAVLVGLVLFEVKLNYLYFIAFVVIVAGIVLYNQAPLEDVEEHRDLAEACRKTWRTLFCLNDDAERKSLIDAESSEFEKDENNQYFGRDDMEVLPSKYVGLAATECKSTANGHPPC
eukprot:gb/GECG01014442.1/.p1 GENE.gb/GECG01014442.1/~~gb/GECG01014442.1/.p1  ORF type:complete len:393 (+),score=26.49 gb/GECG01014442.1/:1-1179(+)